MVLDWYRYVSLSEFRNHKFWSTLTTETTGCTFRQLYKRTSKQTKISLSYFRVQGDNLKENFPQNHSVTQITAAINETLTGTVAFEALHRLQPRPQLCTGDTAISRFRIGTKSSPRFYTFSTRDRTWLPVVPFSITTVH